MYLENTLRVMIAVHVVDFSGKNATVGQVQKLVGNGITRRQTEKCLAELMALELIKSYSFQWRPAVRATRFMMGTGDTSLTFLFAAMGVVDDMYAPHKSAFRYVRDRYITMVSEAG